MSSAGPGLPFAFADFNGDNLPDVASIQPGNRDSANTSEYWIEIQLSGSGSRLIRLVAPVGGLQLEARDVNGDKAIDLVLSTAWLSQPVAILLNDGRGRFREVEPSNSPEAFRRSKTNWAVRTTHTVEPIGVVHESRTSPCVREGRALRLTSDIRAAQISNPVFASAPLLAGCAGRAPPSELL